MSGRTVWLTGLPSAGKTTIANAVAERLDGPVDVLDAITLIAVANVAWFGRRWLRTRFAPALARSA